MTERQAAVIELLQLPDEAEDDQKRRHHLTVEGHEDRYRLIPEFRAISCAHLEVDRCGELIQIEEA
jgi:hypothetical protein